MAEVIRAVFLIGVVLLLGVLAFLVWDLHRIAPRVKRKALVHYDPMAEGTETAWSAEVAGRIVYRCSSFSELHERLLKRYGGYGGVDIQKDDLAFFRNMRDVYK